MSRVRFGAFEADLGSGELFRDGQRLALQRQPFQVLALLIARAGEVVTREELRKQLWPDGTIVDFEHSLNTAVRKVRRALGDSPESARFVETLPGRGYRLALAAERVGPRADAVPCRDARGSELRELAASLGAELVADPGGEVARLVAALFVGSEESVRSANSLRRQARAEGGAEARPLRSPVRRAG
jgi:DNA-binding winged helix-turn-helix (wHTH) protein